MNDHVLDRPVWSALASVHTKFSIGSQHARRFQDDISPFGAARDESANSLAELGRLIESTGSIVLAQASPIICPPGTRATTMTLASQMLFEQSELQPRGGYSIGQLGKDDAPSMMALATLTNPGPFSARTYLLGEYWGIKDNGHLVAMAGERFKQPGFTEISGICTHPDYCGRGFAQELCLMLIDRIMSRGEQAYLHVYVSNTAASMLYKKLGFRERKQLHTGLLECA